MADLKFEVVEKYGIISESSKGWTKEFNLVSWNDRDPKYDLREWSPEGDKMTKGITLSKSEALKLREILSSLDLD